MSINLTFGTSAKAAAVSQIVTEGIRSRSLDAALTRHGALLSSDDKATLLALTVEELAALESVNTKLAPLGIDAMY